MIVTPKTRVWDLESFKTIENEKLKNYFITSAMAWKDDSVGSLVLSIIYANEGTIRTDYEEFIPSEAEFPDYQKRYNEMWRLINLSLAEDILNIGEDIQEFQSWVFQILNEYNHSIPYTQNILNLTSILRALSEEIISIDVIRFLIEDAKWNMNYYGKQ